MGHMYYPGCAAYIGKNEDMYVQIIDMIDGYLILDIDGYYHRCKYAHLSRFRYSVQSMTDESYIKYVNDKVLCNTELIATEIRYYKGNRTFVFIDKSDCITRIYYGPKSIKENIPRRKLYKNSYIV